MPVNPDDPSTWTLEQFLEHGSTAELTDALGGHLRFERRSEAVVLGAQVGVAGVEALLAALEHLDGGAVVGRRHDVRVDVDGAHRGRALQRHLELRGHRARRRGETACDHEVPARGPVRVAVQQRADDPAVQDARERVVVRRRDEPRDEDVALDDYVIVHVGFALSKLDPEEAARTLALFAELDGSTAP